MRLREGQHAMTDEALSTTYVALLRGINVGGKNKLPMSDVRALFAAAACRDVQTYIQSGNVTFHTDAANVMTLADRITAQIAEQFGLRVPVILRSAAQIGDVLRRNPFLAAGVAPETLHVLFLAEQPRAGDIDGLDLDRSPPDAFIVQGREVYLHLPQGMARTKLTNDYFDTKLATTSTGRNWRTVTKLFALMTADRLL